MLKVSKILQAKGDPKPMSEKDWDAGKGCKKDNNPSQRMIKCSR